MVGEEVRRGVLVTWTVFIDDPTSRAGVTCIAEEYPRA